MMKRTLSALMLSGALLCALSVPALAAEPAAPQTDTSLTQEETLPDSVLYYGTVTEVVRDEAGTVSRLALSSEWYGDYVMNLSADTVWVDAGKRAASDPSDLEAGEAVYVFHSPGLYPLPAAPVRRLCGGPEYAPGYGCPMVPRGRGGDGAGWPPYDHHGQRRIAAPCGRGDPVCGLRHRRGR